VAEPEHARTRTVLLWVVTLTVIAYALVEEYSPSEAVGPGGETELDDSDSDKLRIVSVRPSEVVPGAAVFVRYAGGDASREREVTAEIAKQAVPVLQRSPEQLVVRVPAQLAHGQAKLRVLQGDRRSKPWTLTLRPLPRSEMLRNVIGGLALFVLGLRTVGRALRAYAGRRVRAALTRLTRGQLRPAGLGVLTGLLTQSTTSAVGLFSGLLAARMLKLRAAVVLLVGAQLGVALAAVLLPLFATREALWVVAVGALWVLLSESRLSRALGSVVVGAGLIFHGLGLLQAGCAPLISDPQVVPYLGLLKAPGVTGILTCAAFGALLGALLQGPSPVYALALSLLQQDLLGMREALAVLAGVSLGALLDTFAAAWPFGSEARRLARSHLALTVPMTVLSLTGLPLWLRVSRSLGHAAVAGSQDATVAPHGLGAGFLSFQLAAALLAFVLVPFGMRVSDVWSRRSSLRPTRAIGSGHTEALLEALQACGRALAGVRAVITSGDRSSAPATERALADARALLQARLSDDPQADEHASPPRAASVACLHLVDALLASLRVAEKAPELGLTITPDTARALDHLHEVVERALVDVSEPLASHQLPSLTQAQAHEIEINALEAETRRHMFAERTGRDELALRLWSSELCSAYENVGNQVYRVANALGAHADDDA
jgi:Na+/phosphate symporter